MAVKFGVKIVMDSAEIPKTAFADGKFGEFITENAFFLESFYRMEKPIHHGIPYTELYNFIDRIKQTGEAKIRIKPTRGLFKVTMFEDAAAKTLQEKVENAFRDQRRITHNSDIIRLCAATRREDCLELEIARTKYAEQVRSNLIVDYCPDGHDTSLRSYLANEKFGKLPDLSDMRLANSIGLAILVYYRDRGRLTPFFVPRSREVAIFNHGNWHCTASGAAEWPEDPDSTPTDFEHYFLDDLYAELREEVGLRAEDLTDVVPLALCREFARAGKPQMFFIGFTDLSHDQLVERMEKARRTTLPRAEPTEVYRMPFFRFPSQLEDLDTIAREFEARGFTTEAAGNLYYATRFIAETGMDAAEDE